MSKISEDILLIDGLEYCNWNRELFENAHQAGLTAIHATLVYWENTEESFEKINYWHRLFKEHHDICLLYTSPSPRDMRRSRMPSSA